MILVAFVFGYSCGGGLRRQMRQQLEDLRLDLREREKLMVERAKREERVIKSVLERSGIATAEDDGKPQTIDRSRRRIAELMQQRRQREWTEQEQQAHEAFTQEE